MSGTGSHQAQSFQIANLLEKMNSADKDYRFMATNDLMTELSKDSIKLDEDSERKVVRMLLKLLEDKNGEVQNLAVKCLGPLVNKVKDTQVENIVDTLCCNMRAAENEQLRDVSSIGLKTVIHALPPSSSALASNICKRITPQLTSAIGQNDVQPVQLEALDILAELLLRHGGVLINFHTSIQEALLPQLASPRLAIRKRTITALSHLVGTCSGNDFQRIMNYLVEQLQVNKEISTTRTYVNAVASVCRAAGHRFGEYLDTVMKLLMNFCTREDDELRESCIQAFESFVVRCPREVATWIRPIIELCAKFLCYDPNYHYEDADSGMNGDMSGDDPSASESDQEYSDDEDMSWKVRRASAKCLEAILVTRRELLLEFYETISPLLISRFKEREENVKTDIFSAYVALLKHTKVAMPSSRDYMNAEDDRTEARKLASKVEEEIPKIVATLTKQLRDKSIKTRQSCFSLLQQLLLLMPGALGGQMSHLIPGILYSLSEKSSNQSMKIETLSFLRVAISTHPPEVFQPHVRDLVPMVLNVVDDSFYKVIGEALAVIQQLMQVMRPVSGDMSDFDYQPYVQQTYDVIHARLKATDIDQEVKERAISCAGQFVASFGDQYPNYVQSCMPLLLDRLRNEITRLTCVRALITVIQSAYPVNVAAYLPDAVPELASFLRKNQRVLKLATLQLLTAMAADRYAHVLKSSEGLNEVLTEIPPLLSEADLQIAQMAADFLTRVLRLNSDAVLQHLNAALEQLGKLILSPLLQGTSLETVLSFLATLMETGLPNMTFNGLVQMLVQPIHDTTKVHKTGYRNTGKAIAVLCAYNPAESGRIVGEMISQLQSKTSSEGVVYFSLICLGEIGRIYPEALKQLSIEKLILEAFHSNKEDIQKAASQALGLVAAGNLEKYLPFVLKEIQSQRNRQYLLLIALKEIISAESDDERHIQILSPHVPDIWKVLIDHSQCAEEGTRNVVSECLGRLTLLDPVSLLPKLKGHLGSPSALARATVITALKFTIADQPQPIDPYLKACIGEFLRALRDEDLLVRRVALVTFNSAGHNKPVLIRDLLDELLPALYHETKVRKDLVREVEMGPFKHTVDDGLDLRKAAFECMYTLLETCLERLDIFVFLEHVEDGLKDHYDIKMLTYLMLVRLSHLCPTQVLQRVEQLIEPMKQVCTAKVKANSVKQEFEKNDELKRACIRAFVALQQIPEAERNPQVNDFLASLRQSPDTAGMVDSILKDPSKQIYGDAGDNMEIG